MDLKVVQGRILISYGGKEIASHALLNHKNGQVICGAHYAGLMSARGQQRGHAKRPQHDPTWKEEVNTVAIRSLSLYEQIANMTSFLIGVAW